MTHSVARAVRNALLALTIGASAHPALAQSPPLRIGVLNDQSGMYADLSGPGSVVAATMAAEDAGGTVLGRKIEVLTGDHQNKADVGAAVAAQWYDTQGVSAIVDVPVSSVALAVQDVARKRQKIVMFSGAGSSDLTGKACSPTGFAWTYDTIALANGTGSAIVKAGGDTWFFLTADYAFGTAAEHDVSEVVRANGGRVVGAVRIAMSTTDFSSFLLQAQASHAKIIGLANAGSDLINAIKQASEFGIVAAGQKLAGLLVFISDVHSLGLQTAQGLQLTESFYWDQNDGTRAFADRFAARTGGKRPTMVQAGVYSAVAHYLKAVAKAGTDDGPAVADAIRAIPVDDFMTDHVAVRIDGRVLRDFYLFEVKSPAESKGPWDLYKLIRRIPAQDAVRPLAQGGCPLVK
ncbi:MAG: ABC transporter substrate-binding protein [Janthinobacterium lividum]